MNEEGQVDVVSCEAPAERSRVLFEITVNIQDSVNGRQYLAHSDSLPSFAGGGATPGEAVRNLLDYYGELGVRKLLAERNF